MNYLCLNETWSCTTTHLCCHWSTDSYWLKNVTCKPSTHSKNQDIGLKTNRWHHCWASTLFLNKDLVFFEQVLSLQVSVETGESAQPLTTGITDQLMSDDTVVGPLWGLTRQCCGYWNRSRIFITFFSISSFTAHISKILNTNNEFSCLRENIYPSEVSTFSYLAKWIVT